MKYCSKKIWHPTYQYIYVYYLNIGTSTTNPTHQKEHLYYYSKHLAKNLVLQVYTCYVRIEKSEVLRKSPIKFKILNPVNLTEW